MDTSFRDNLRNGAARDLKKEDIWCVRNGGLEVLSSYLVILTLLRDISSGGVSQDLGESLIFLNK